MIIKDKKNQTFNPCAKIDSKPLVLFKREKLGNAYIKH